MDSVTSEIKAKLNVEDVIGEYLQLQRAGRNLKSCCPFHHEKTPSFMVSPERQSWHCFGCGEGGDIFTFVMKMEGVDFVDALKILGEKAGVEIKRKTYKKEFGEDKDNLLGALEASKQFYQHCLKIKGGRKAYEYLLARGLTDETIAQFELGYAPDSWTLLSEYLKKKGFSEKEIMGAGMTVRKESGGAYDRFRGRIMFPINSIAGQTLGFSSRVMPGGDETQAKYINTPETLIYNKGRVLYGLDKAKVAVRQADECILVEGNLDVIASHQAEVKNAVATCGTALTSEQLRIIKRYTDNIVFSFDQDAAGVKAAGRAIELALEAGMNVSMIQIPEGKDPADSVKKDPALWQQASRQKVKVMDFYFTSAFGKNNAAEVEGKKQIADELLKVIAKLSNKIEQSYYLQKLSADLDINEEVLRTAMEAAGKISSHEQRETAKEEEKVSVSFTPEQKLQRRLIGAFIVEPELFGNFAGQEELFSDPLAAKLYAYFSEIFEKNKGLNKEALEALIRQWEKERGLADHSELLQGYNAAAFSFEASSEAINLAEEARMCALNLRKLKLDARLKETTRKIAAAKKQNNVELENELIAKQADLIREKSQLPG